MERKTESEKEIRPPSTSIFPLGNVKYSSSIVATVEKQI